MKLSSITATFLADLKAIVSARRVLTYLNATRPFRVGFRSGGGPVLAVVQPTSLVQLWRLVRLCVRANKIIIMQAVNTGFTGGSTPLQEG